MCCTVRYHPLLKKEGSSRSHSINGSLAYSFLFNNVIQLLSIKINIQTFSKAQANRLLVNHIAISI